MIVARASCVRRDQAEISSIVRLQPTQSRASGWMTQTLTHGLSISSRRQKSSLHRVLSRLRAQMRQPVQQRLAGYSLPRRVDHLGATLS
jgi:hypothetical protein